MKFSELKIWESLPQEPSYYPPFFRRGFDTKDELDSLFAQLEKFDDTKKEELLSECNSIMSRHALSPTPPLSDAVIASLFAVKMQIYLQTNDEPNIRKNYAGFLRAAGTLLGAAYQMNEEGQRAFTKSLIETARELTRYLTPIISLKDGTGIGAVPVPDILASASSVTDGEINLNNVRKLFYELWQNEELRPLLHFAAYATQGVHCDRDGAVTTKHPPLQIIFSKDPLVRVGGDQHGGFCAGYNTVFIQLASEFELKKRIAHELHHYFEEVFHSSNQLLPYSPSDTGAKKRLDAMFAEATKARPEVFRDVAEYAGADKNERIRHAEVVVRVSEFLAALGKTGTDWMSYTPKRGDLTECVKFFKEEQYRMREAVEKMSSTATFDQNIPTTSIVPEYLTYSPAPDESHLAKDSLGRTNLERLIDEDNAPKLIEWCGLEEFWRMLTEKKNEHFLSVTIRYLAGLVKNNEEHGETVRNLLKTNKSVDSFKSEIGRNCHLLLDKKIERKIETSSIEEILRAVDAKEIPFRDEFGNEISEYLRCVSWEKSNKILNKLEEKYDFSGVQISDQFLPTHPLRKAVIKDQPWDFLLHAKTKEDLLMRFENRKSDNNSMIEILASCCVSGDNKDVWRKVFDEVIKRHSIDINQCFSPEVNDRKLVDLSRPEKVVSESPKPVTTSKLATNKVAPAQTHGG